MRMSALAGLGMAAMSAMAILVMSPAQAAAGGPRETTTSVLYSLTGDEATMRLMPGSGDRFAFTLKRPDVRTIWFADRPARNSGTIATDTFIRQWSGYGFATDPPNVAITLHTRSGVTDTIVVVMRKPRITSAGVLRATMQVLSVEAADNLRGNLARHGNAHDPVGIPVKLGSVSLFIDDVTGTVVGGCLIQPGTVCTAANLYQANLAGADLAGATLEWAYLAGANLSGANLSGAYLDNADLTGANLSGANLSMASLQCAGVQGANFSGANQSGAAFSCLNNIS